MPSAKLKRAGVSNAKFDRCLTQVRAKSGDKVNEFAVCESSMQRARGLRPKRKTRREIRTRR